jgi:hypothetical protein
MQVNFARFPGGSRGPPVEAAIWVPAFPTDQVRGLKAHGTAAQAVFHPGRVGSKPVRNSQCRSPFLPKQPAGVLQVECGGQIPGLMHETENQRRLRFGVVDQKVRKTAQGPKPILLRRQFEPDASEFQPRL